MIRYLIKNNFKLMFRNKWSMPVMILGPFIVIAVLSSAFSNLMKSYEGVGAFQVGYRVEAGSIFERSIAQIKDAGQEADITFVEYPEGEAGEVIENNGLAGFVEFGKDNYTLYESTDYEIEGHTLEYFLNRVMRTYISGAVQAMMPGVEKERIQLPVEEIDYLPAVNSRDYYGIIYIVYFSWCGIICAASVLNNEKKYGIGRKLQMTPVSGFKLYLGKLIPVILVVSAGMGISVMLTVLLYGIHWGGISISCLLLFLTIVAASSYGIMLYYFSDNVVITIILLFSSVWFMGFFGGSFETYMFSNWSDQIKNLSPIYHANRALVENSCMGHSAYTGSCIIYMLLITVICSSAAVAAYKIRRRGRA